MASVNADYAFSIESFMHSYRQDIHPSKHGALKVAEACGTALRQAQILHEISHNTIPNARLEEELKLREKFRGKPYAKKGEIETDIVDLATVFIHVHLPRDKSRVRRILRETFKVQSEPTGAIDDVGTEPELTNMDAEYYWVSLGEEVWPPRNVMIQVETDPGDRCLETQLEMNTFLHKWAAIQGREMGQGADCGDVLPLWELTRLLNLRYVNDFRNFLASLDFSAGPESAFALRAGEFAPGLELSLAMFVADSLIRSAQGKEMIQKTIEFWRSRPEAEQQREKTRIVRDSFIWLVRLYSWGNGAADMLCDSLNKQMQGRYQRAIAWLGKPATRSFYYGSVAVLAENEANELEKLWRLFEGHHRLPIQYIFNLARLGVKGHPEPCWDGFYDAVADLDLLPNCLDDPDYQRRR
ncbi:predicted protein [Aspergillus nidulans FGSC A4]|uniref:RelA/SpoT domain-containing protein n=1 Tax=Emericella nidulans (strain FGSC A4 / ATCC 38163 / CBS 112.46 / NRRL 194 / M139) TaxID=227321 RepID=Q5BCB5_EMENI|nr:hypothetical protein [Aspergillus nidulans FGSC A4]EAA64980.1 predicted protein [Aspergillus nidulans FGSC A4]CBF85615.1 TPA: conserved hypothetical protein [Aspergillus nidulans FGSC A4]|eukprot:XP_659419.1 predicted protein [Aspergillus nidulans FGSC A4]